MNTCLRAALLGMLSIALPLSAETILDETIPIPGGFAASPSEQDAQYWLMRWTPVEGASYYRIWREVVVDHKLDQGVVVELDQPESMWIPWAKVDVVVGMDPFQAQVAALDNIQTRWGITTVVEKEGAEYLSPMVIAEDTGTAVESLGWGAVKAGAGQ